MRTARTSDACEESMKESAHAPSMTAFEAHRALHNQIAINRNLHKELDQRDHAIQTLKAQNKKLRETLLRVAGGLVEIDEMMDESRGL